MNKTVRGLMVFFALLALTGCATHSPGLQPWPMTAFEGGALVLHQDLVVPPGDGVAYIQAGRVVSISDWAEFEPYCKFELSGPNLLPVTVGSGQFRIDRVRRVSDPMGIASLRYLVADASGGGNGGGPGYFTRGSEFYLSGGQEQVWRLVCAELVESWELREPGVGTMRAQLGSLMSLTEAR